MDRMKRFAPVVVVALVLAACGPLSMVVPTPARPVAISSFEVQYGPGVPSDRRDLLDSVGALPTMQTALRIAYPVGTGPRVRVTIMDFSAPRWGRARMQAVVQLIGPDATTLRTFEVESVTPFTRQTRGWYVRRVSQGVVDRIAAQL